MSIQISKGLLNQVIDYCKMAFPHEACGVWLGKEKRESPEIQINDFRGITNISTSPEHDFLMHPGEWIETVYQCQQQHELTLLGIFHSHPRTPAVPSDHDLATLWKQFPTYWIISLQQLERPQVGVFRLMDDKSYERLSINIVENH